jgi:signal transduction histidine kinase
VVEGEWKQAFDNVTWEIDPQAEEKAARLPPAISEVAFYAAREAIRNAARHARHVDTDIPLNLDLRIEWRSGLNIEIGDNGIGLNQGEKEGKASSDGSGQGLALHSTLMAVVGGSLVMDSAPGRFTRVTLSLPDSLSRLE